MGSQRLVRQMLEKVIEKKVCEYAKTLGVLQFKLTSTSSVGLPDRMFINKSGKIYFIEFKRKGKKPTEMQLFIHRKLQGHNCNVFVVDDVDVGKKLIVELC